MTMAAENTSGTTTATGDAPLLGPPCVGLTMMEQRITTRRANLGLAFDPIIIIAIIGIIINLIAQCWLARRRPTPQELRQDKPLKRMRMAIALRKEYPQMSFRQAFVEVDVALAELDAATDAELDTVIGDCQP